jgi:hypothetical protein
VGLIAVLLDEQVPLRGKRLERLLVLVEFLVCGVPLAVGFLLAGVSRLFLLLLALGLLLGLGGGALGLAMALAGGREGLGKGEGRVVLGGVGRAPLDLFLALGAGGGEFLLRKTGLLLADPAA